MSDKQTTPAIQFIEPIARFTAILSALLYAAGFVVVNAHLSRYGVLDYALANSKFVFAGVLCAVYFIIWWWMPGRHINSIAFLTTYAKENFKQKNSRLGWIGIIRETIVAIPHKLLAAAACFTFLALEDGYIILPAAVALLFPVPIMTTLSHADFETKYPLPFYTLGIILELISMIAFWTFGGFEGSTGAVVSNYFNLGLLFIFIEDILKRKSLTTEFFVSSMLWHTVLILGFIISFGTAFYGVTKPQYGGGAPVPVDVSLKTKIQVGDQELSALNDATLLYTFEKSYLLSASNKTFLIISDQINAMHIKERQKADPYARYIDAIKAFRSFFGIPS